LVHKLPVDVIYSIAYIDEYVHELVNEGNYKELEGYLINGFQGLAAILKAHPGDGLEETEAKQLSDFINVTIPQVEVFTNRMCKGGLG
jgi:hypothetical protein